MPRIEAEEEPLRLSKEALQAQQQRGLGEQLVVDAASTHLDAAVVAKAMDLLQVAGHTP